MSKDQSKVAAAKARAESLSQERRSEIARRAAASRWGRTAISQEGELNLGNAELKCFVLDDETRVLSRASFVRAIGRKGKVKGGRQYDEDFSVPVFISAKNLRPFFPEGIEENAKPVQFTYGDAEMIGYRAELLADVCDIFDDASRAGALQANQRHIAEACRILSRGLTRVGIIGLVDEATGYQRQRAADALAKILEEFIAKELRPWVQTFPADFYENLFRLRGLSFPKDTVKRPPYFGHLTNDIIYKRLAPGVLDEIRKLTPKNSSGRRKHKFHQRLSEDHGHPKLKEHLSAVIALMTVSDDYDQFVRMLDKAKPRYGETLFLPGFEDAPKLGL